jgi:nitrate reductase gamma subunit
MRIMFSLGAVLAIVVVALIGGSIPFLQGIFGVLLPYVAFAIFLVGFCMKVTNWAKSPVPFRIPTTAGQEYSLPWIKQAKIENPSTTGGVLVRMFFEIFLFRSLFRNTKADLRSGYLMYGPTKWLWFFALLFHYSFLVIAIRHLRIVLQPTPGFVELIDKIDGMFQIGHPYMYLTDGIFILALLFLLARRLLLSKVRFISLPADYFPLFLILAIGITGMMMRFWTRVDLVAIKALANGLVSFHPTVPDGISALFIVHLTLVSVLFAYFPFSKLMHMGGVFMSPTRNMANNNRMVHHDNPWRQPSKFHSYDEYEDAYRDMMKDAGIPVEKG